MMRGAIRSKKKPGRFRPGSFCRISNARGNLPEGTADTIIRSQGGSDERIITSTA
jgi:hypothetical protein